LEFLFLEFIKSDINVIPILPNTCVKPPPFWILYVAEIAECIF